MDRTHCAGSDDRAPGGEARMSARTSPPRAGPRWRTSCSPSSASPQRLARGRRQLHQAVSDYLASAPADLRGWAHAQARSLDAAYLKLPTRSVSRARPSGARRGRRRSYPAGRRHLRPAGAPPRRPSPMRSCPWTRRRGLVLARSRASPTPRTSPPCTPRDPSAHADMAPDVPRGGAAPRGRQPPECRDGSPPGAAPATRAHLERRHDLGAIAFGVVGLVTVAASRLPGTRRHGTAARRRPPPGLPRPRSTRPRSAPHADIRANPKDTDTLIALANEFYSGEEYRRPPAGSTRCWRSIRSNIRPCYARARSSTTAGLPVAEATWKHVLGIEPNNRRSITTSASCTSTSATPDL